MAAVAMVMVWVYGTDEEEEADGYEEVRKDEFGEMEERGVTVEVFTATYKAHEDEGKGDVCDSAAKDVEESFGC